MLSERSEQDAKIGAIGRQLTQREAERATTSANIAKIQATIPVLRERVDIHKSLLDKGLASKVVYLAGLQDLVGLQQDVVVQQSKLREADAAVSLLKETNEKAVAECRRTVYDALSKAEHKAAGLKQDVIKAEQRTKLQRLTAPVDGVVQQLAVHTVGDVVTPAQALAIVVPTQPPLEIEAKVSNRDIGFVHAGQKVEIKVDTFNFTRYGLLHGEVISLSSDAITRDTQPTRSNGRNGDMTSTSEPRSQELEYAARISLDRTDMQVDEKARQARPRNGRHRRDQDRFAQNHQLSALTAGKISTRRSAGTIGLQILFDRYFEALS